MRWTYDSEQFTVKEVRIDGASDDSYLKEKEIEFKELKADHNVEIVLGKKGPSQRPNDKKEEYQITTERTQGGRIDPSVRVSEGSEQQISWEAEAGYVVASVSVDGQKRKDLLDQGSVWFRNISQDHQVSVVFAKEGEAGPDVKDLYAINTKIGEGEGYIDSSVRVEGGAEHTVRWYPSAGYEVKSVIIDGEVRDDLSGMSEMKFEDIREDHTIAVLFEKIEKDEEEKTELSKESYRIEMSQEGKGTVSYSAVVAKGGELYSKLQSSSWI